jgi:hypothetical protein
MKFLHNVILQKDFSHPSFVVYFFFPNPHPSKLKLGLQIGEETTNSKPPEPIIMISQSETGSSSEIIYSLHASLEGVRLCCAIHQPHSKV